MSRHESIGRRRFLEETTLLAAVASGLGAARPAAAQINNSAALPVKPVRVGFVGVGIRGTLLMEAVKGIAGAEIVAAADCYKGHLDRAKELISPSLQTTGDYRQVVTRPDVDAVVIATPDHWHLQMTREALAAGKHVYIEKPMTHSWEEGEAFIEAAEKSGKVLQVGSQYPSMGCTREAAELIKSRAPRPGDAHRGAHPPQHGDRRLVLPDSPTPRPTIDWKSFLGSAPPCDFDLRRFFQWRLFWDYSGGLPTDLFVHLITAVHQMMGVQEPERGQLRRHLPLEGAARCPTR